MKEVIQMTRLTYQEWEQLTPQEQDRIPKDALPWIPQEELSNGLIWSQMILKDGERLWAITQGDKTEVFPRLHR
jgi:hypothetical protein